MRENLYYFPSTVYKRASWPHLILPFFLPSLQFYWFLSFLVFFYILSPLFAGLILETNYFAMMKVFRLGCVAVLFLLFGYYLSYFKSIRFSHPIFFCKTRTMIVSVYLVFVLLIFLILKTASDVPLMTALYSNDVYEISVTRALFLKARVGWEIILRYLTAILTTSFIPYIILLSFIISYRLKWLIFFTALFFSFLLLEKAFFLKFFLPLLSLSSAQWFLEKNQVEKKKILFTFLGLLISIPILLYANTVLSRFGNVKGQAAGAVVSEPVITKFYSAPYVVDANQGRFHFLLWRFMAVPVFTAADSLDLFHEKYNDHYLLGKTSRSLSTLTKQTHIQFEREVFVSEWGDEETHTASANAVYFVEQYVNFGWLGVMVSSFMLGIIFRKLCESKDLALAGLSIIFSFSLAIGGFIATFLSGGFLFLFLLHMMVGFKR